MIIFLVVKLHVTLATKEVESICRGGYVGVSDFTRGVHRLEMFWSFKLCICVGVGICYECVGVEML